VVGRGSGEILHLLQQRMFQIYTFAGDEISPHAFNLCMQRGKERMCFKLKNFIEENDATCDLILLIALIEHLEDCFQFLREIKGKSQYKILLIPIEMNALSALYP
jgi:hypothetical protein